MQSNLLPTMLSFAALLFPALALPLLLLLGTPVPHAPRLFDFARWPAELFVMAGSGIPATIAGILDWRWHRSGGRKIPRAERRAELAALGCGSLLFVLLALASASRAAGLLLVPILVVALATTVLIVYDELRFHRSCGRYESTLHRILVLGNGVAFLAWVQWCFVSQGTDVPLS